MIRYALIDGDGNAYNLDDSTFRLLNDISRIESDTIERSFRAGADFPGIQRDESKSLTYQYDVNFKDEQDFRLKINTYKYQFRKTRKIRDIINNQEIDAIVEEDSINYDDGGFNHGGGLSVTFKILTPYWEDVDYTTVQDSGISAGLIVITNSGFIDIPFVATITALEAITKFSIRISETGEGIFISDLQFGSNGLNTYIIDTKEGTAELNTLLRNDQIKSGTGFFNFRVGTNTIIISSNGSISIEIKYKQRYFI